MKSMATLLLEEILSINDGSEEAVITLFVRDEYEGGFNWGNGLRRKRSYY